MRHTRLHAVRACSTRFLPEKLSKQSGKSYQKETNMTGITRGVFNRLFRLTHYSFLHENEET